MIKCNCPLSCSRDNVLLESMAFEIINITS